MTKPRNGKPLQDPQLDPKGQGGHSWMMIVCCVPMLVIAIVLLATGVVGINFVLIAVMCTVMMALMMRGMGHSS